MLRPAWTANYHTVAHIRQKYHAPRTPTTTEVNRRRLRFKRTVMGRFRRKLAAQGMTDTRPYRRPAKCRDRERARAARPHPILRRRGVPTRRRLGGSHVPPRPVDLERTTRCASLPPRSQSARKVHRYRTASGSSNDYVRPSPRSRIEREVKISSTTYGRQHLANIAMVTLRRDCVVLPLRRAAD